MENKRRLALLIDGENAQASLLPQILDAVGKLGLITKRYVYGDWSSDEMKKWKQIALTHALQTEHRSRIVKGKNATDIALTVGAMDILHANSVDGFCIVASDSDYTSLAQRIRQQNLFVLGVGEPKTPQDFVDSCDEFIYTDDLQAAVNEPAPIIVDEPKGKWVEPQPVTAVMPIPKKTNVIGLKKLFRKAFALATTEDGWVNLATMGSLLRQAEPTFDYQTYGHSQLLKLLEANTNLVNIHKVKAEDGKETVYVSLKVSQS